MLKKFFISFIIAGAIFAPFSFAIRKNNAEGYYQIPSIEIYGDETWTAEDNPYVFDWPSIYIHEGAALTLEAGVIMKMLSAGITVEGSLAINGVENNPVIITSNNDNSYGGDTNSNDNFSPHYDDWNGIIIKSGGKLIANHMLIQYGGGETGAISVEGGEAEINNSTLTKNNIGIAVYDGTAKIHNSKIFSNSLGGIVNNSANQIKATDNWWGDNSGPFHETLNSQGKGDIIAGDILFDPWVGKEKKKDPVIIVPGIIGSYLNRNDNGKTEVWPNAAKMIIDPWDSYLNELAIESTGWPNIDNPILLPTDIFREMVDKDFFQSLIVELEKNGYKENENLFVFPYDWRWFIDWSANNGDPFPLVKSLQEKIEEIKNQTGAEKVDIIAHSMGGLVAKDYIKHYGFNSVDKFIDIATPHLGAPQAFKILMFGDNLGLPFLLNRGRIQSISQNFPSIYQLLPGKNYFDNSNPDYNYYVSDIHDLDNNGVKGNLNYDQSIEFMKNTGRNDYLLGFNDSLHNDLDDYSPKQDGVKTYNIVGCGNPTLGKIYVLNKEKSGGYEYGLKYINGDGTVPLKSAESLDADSLYYVKDIEHAYLSSSDGVKQLAAAILKGEENSFPLADYSNLSIEENCSFSGTQISFHSPIELHIYDENNNHVGPNKNGDIEMEIEGAQYDIIENNKFAFLPSGHNYRIIGKATNSGSFNARVQEINNNQYGQTTYYNEVPLQTASTAIQLEVNNDQIDNKIKIDQNGDFIFESEFAPSAVLDEQEAQDLTKPQTDIAISGNAGNNGWHTSDVEISLNAADNENGSGVLKTEYSLDNGQNWQTYQEPFKIDKEGVNKIICQSTDRAGNIEEAKEQIIKIDKTGPYINIFSPLEQREYLHSEKINLDYYIEDELSGFATGTEKTHLDDQPLTTTSLDLFYNNLGEHQLKIIAQDQAGNIGEKIINFSVIATIDSAISDVNISYAQKYIFKKSVRDDLTLQLNLIKKFIEKIGQRIEKHEKRNQDLYQQCLARRNKKWCDFQFYQRSRILYNLDKISQKIISVQYRLVLKQLDLYYKKKWINDSGYDIINQDINYLIINIK